jgi:hypothetical protein
MRHYYFRRNGSSLKSWIEDQNQSRSDHEMKMKQRSSWSIEHQIYNDTSQIPSEGPFGPQTQTMGGRPFSPNIYHKVTSFSLTYVSEKFYAPENRA